MSSLILIDTSYTNFYRFYATIKWYSFAFVDNFKQENNNEYDWSLNTIFMEKYEKMYLNSIINIFNKDIYNNSKIIFCMDSNLNTLWKTKKYADYKYKRKMIIKKYNYTNVFKYTFDILIPNIIKNNTNIYYININKLEADDIIGCICIYLKNNENNIHIISSDKDLLQLGRNNVYFYDYKLKKSITLSEAEAYILLKKKIIYGDISDCIQGIYEKGYNIKKKDLIDDDILNEYLNKNIKAKEKYTFNQKIIDFNYIPTKYYNKVVNKFIKIFK